ncbi:MAG: radical SAM protein [Deltaproteobacteria bacterium]|nr:radical SAM protein [Deltaproteobacteria bacterium]MBW2021070.1 radical SAM protein [Deltaproteobacteria bacterium]MBW2073827.1 radical SAM protein [Deltaproteobacteria bacterium]
MAFFKKSRFTVDIPVENSREALIALYQTMTGAFILIPEKTWSYILSDPMAPADPAAIDMLCDQGFLVKEGVDEAIVFENWKQQYVHDFSTLRSKVLVTRKCNNRCRYCILDPEAREMSPDTARAMDRFYIEIIQEKNPQRVEDDYLGGEPLLNSEIILESAARRFYYCLGRGIEYGFTITTNGTLLRPSMISGMKEVGLTGIRVSLAGPAPVHDFLRPSKNNGKTYDLIMENLQAVSGLIPINIECQYDSGALDFLSIPEMLDDMGERHIAIENITFTPILARRGESPYDSGMGDPKILQYLMQEAEKRGYLQDREAPSNTCMADFRARFVFDTDGSIIPCPSLQGGEMAYGHVTKGIDFVSESQLLKRRLPDRCLNKCPILPICMGGCRMQALVHEKDFNGVDCHYNTYRFFLEDYIRQRASAVLSQEESIRLKKAA